MIINYVSILLIILGLIIIIIDVILSKYNNNKPVKKVIKDKKIAILIPARYESNVIESLLLSIKKQSYSINMRDVYVIIESKKDETYNICKKYNASCFIRKRLDLKTKGYALDEVVKDILSNNKHYDYYFIFDADNILDKNYLKNMIPIMDMGYDISTGYRNCKNGNSSVVSASSSLTFSLINTLLNNIKTKNTNNITLSGTGFYIKGDIIEKLQGYPFNSLTEDYELTIYSIINDLTSYYNKKSIYYDEQPVKFSVTINQRMRWIKGYFYVWKNNILKVIKSINKNSCNNGSKIDAVIGVIPYILFIISLFLLLINFIFNFNFIYIIYLLLIVYLVLVIVTIILLIKEKNSLDINNKMRLKVLFYNPLFIASYLISAIKALFKKEVKWDRINHGN